jgi:hypothetical protein
MKKDRLKNKPKGKMFFQYMFKSRTYARAQRCDCQQIWLFEVLPPLCHKHLLERNMSKKNKGKEKEKEKK